MDAETQCIVWSLQLLTSDCKMLLILKWLNWLTIMTLDSNVEDSKEDFVFFTLI